MMEDGAVQVVESLILMGLLSMKFVGMLGVGRRGGVSHALVRGICYGSQGLSHRR